MTRRMIKMSAFQRIECLQPSKRWSPADAYDVAAEGYDQWHWQKVWLVSERSLITDALRSHASSPRVLDIGCGTGALLARIYASGASCSELVGVDISRGMLLRAQRNFGDLPIKFIHEDFLSSRFPEKSFDIIFMCRVASHIADLQHCFDRVASLMRDGGTFAFSDVYSGHPYECTRLPLRGGKVPVVTYKHRLRDIVRVAYRSSMTVVGFKGCWVGGLPEDVKKDPDLPHALLDQLKNGITVPFGSLITFALRG